MQTVSGVPVELKLGPTNLGRGNEAGGTEVYGEGARCTDEGLISP